MSLSYPRSASTNQLCGKELVIAPVGYKNSIVMLRHPVGFKNSGGGDNRPMALTFLYVIVGRTFRLLVGRLASDAHQDVEIAVLRHELVILRRRVKRPRYCAADRAVLTTFAQLLPRRLWHDFLVKPETVMRWHRQLVAAKWTHPRRRPGRSALEQHLVDLIVRIARENRRWGYMRIRGELRKLCLSVSATSIRSVLLRNNLGPAPRRSARTWRQFLKA